MKGGPALGGRDSHAVPGRHPGPSLAASATFDRDDTVISGATGSTYTLTSAEAGKTIKVRVTFTDDGGTEETLESAATAVVEAGLTARFENVPASHDSSSVFRLRIAFSEEVFEGSEPFDKNQAIQDALVVNGGAVTGRARVNRNEFDQWWIRVAPSGNGAVTVSLPAQTDCAGAGAVCTPDGAALVSPVSATVPGPVSQTREVSIVAKDDSRTVTEGTAAEFTLTRTGSLADALTVNVGVTETGTMLSGAVPATVTFNANSPTAELRVETEDDEVAEPASVVTAALAAGSGYSMDTGAASASVMVEDDDAAPVVQTAAIVRVPENTTTVVTLTATDDDTPVADLAWSIVGGVDAAMFIVSAGGDLAFASAKDFEAPDDADTDGKYEVTVRVTDGANADDAALTVRLADVKEISPVLTDANVNGESLTLTFGEPLDGGSVPAPSAFSVTVGGAARGVSDVSMSGNSVTLTLVSAVVFGETITVGYTVPTGANGRPLRDAAENAVAGFSNRAVTNATPASNAAPVGLPTVSGTPEVGETLMASSVGITDTDGLTNATYAWQWVANDGTADTDIAGATGSTYTLTSAEAGKTIKVRATFTDDRGTEETVLSDATAAVTTAYTCTAPNLAGRTEVWAGTLTVAPAEIRGTVYGHGFNREPSGGGNYGALSDTRFDFGGISYVITAVVRAIAPSRIPGLVVMLDKSLPDTERDMLRLHVCGDTFELANVSDNHTGHANRDKRYWWSNPGIDWSSATTVSLALSGTINQSSTGAPAIAGTPQVGQTLTAGPGDIADGNGIANATFAWQWIVNDGTSDTDIAGATGAEYTLTSAEAGKTIKVRVTFTDDGGTEETLVSEATAAVTVALPSVSVAAVSSPVTEGTAASFRLSRSGATAPALTVAVSVTVEGAVVSTAPASSVTFAAGSAEATLNIATVDDGVAEADARVSVSVKAGPGYLVGNGSGSARVDVYDNDEVASAPVETLWTSTLEWQGDYGAGWVNANEEDFSSPGWSEDGDDYRIWYIAYGSSSGELWVRADPNMRAGGIPAPEELTLQVGQVTVEPAGTMARFARGDIAVVRGIEPSWAVGEQIQVRLTRTTAGETTVTGPGVSVADAQVQEAEGAVLAFRVTLAEAQTSAVSVRYATSDGTATAGTDYVSTSGALRFAPGETAKTVSVPVLNDAHDDDGETMMLTLSNSFGAQIADGTATGTITNSDPLQKMWLSRFGRTVAIQTIDALEGRFAIGPDASPRMTMTVAGQSVDLARIGDDNALAETMTGLARAFGAPAANDNDPFARHGFGEALDGTGVSAPARSVTGRDLLLGSSFHFTTGEASGLGGAMTGWGKVLSGGSSSAFGGGLSFASETATGVLGMDWERDRLLVGVALSRSVEKGSASFGPTDVQYDIEGSLSMVTPYLRVRAGDRLSFWSAVGSGSGSMSLSRGGGWQTADVAMRLAAAGGRAELLRPGAAGGLALALKTDAFFVRSESARVSTPGVGNLEAATGDASRLRAVLEGSRAFALSDGGALEPSLSLGLRHDGGDAETGSGVEIGAGLAWSAPAAGLTSDLRLYGLAVHEASGYDEWGASGSLRMVPGPSGRGLSLSMTPSWGAQGQTGRLWDAAPGGLAGNGGSEQPGMRFDTELGYGLPLSDGLTGTPYAGFGFGEAGARDYRLGWRFASDRLRSLTLGIETTRREAANDTGAGSAEHGVTLRAGLRW